jgi:hypothetical protein
VRIKGVTYDVGRELGDNWRPVFEPEVVRRELTIIKDDLHCNAVRICGQDVSRLERAAVLALELGLDVWLSPELWNKMPEPTLRYTVDASRMAEDLFRRCPGKVVLCIGSELTLFMRGILPGRSLLTRVRNMRKSPSRAAGAPALTEYLTRATDAVRGVFSGPLTYASFIWEPVDWSRFDFVGIDHYRDSRIKDRYVDMLRPFLDTGKPVVVTEFGMRTYVGADTSGTLGFGIVYIPSLVLHKLPVVGRFVRTRLKGTPVRNEELQAREIVETLEALDAAGVTGAFVHTFVDYQSPTDPVPKYDLDISSMSLVKLLKNGRSGAYPDLPWEPKEAFRAVARYYAER